MLIRDGDQNMHHCNSVATQVVEVSNPITGRVWMDRNLGASKVANNSNDVSAYGDLYQWGRFGDGHQFRNSAITNALSTGNTPGHEKFIFRKLRIILTGVLFRMTIYGLE